MSDPFLGEIKMVGFNIAPQGWAMCNGQLLSIAQNSALFSLLGTRFGGDGETSFGLPDLRGRRPVHYGTGPGLPPYVIGQKSGAIGRTLEVADLPSHSHLVKCNSASGNAAGPAGAVTATEGSGFTQDYQTNATSADGQEYMHPDMVEPVGSGREINVESPYLTVNFIIALVGIFPST